jgi:tRNA1(Val) A37 N6-methylase TrmN6
VSESLTLDRFLGGRLMIAQPKRGFRAGHDTVLLAAAVPARADEFALELGAGAGVASLCLAARMPGVSLLGVELDPELVRLANENAGRNGMAGRVVFEAGDISGLAARVEQYDHVFFNPPFHPPSSHRSPSEPRAHAMQDGANMVAEWTRIALVLTKPKGTVTAIIRADRTEDVLAPASGHAAIVFPLFPHAGETAKRAVVQITKNAPAGIRMAAGLVLHETDGRNTNASEAVLRHGEALRLA